MLEENRNINESHQTLSDDFASLEVGRRAEIIEEALVELKNAIAYEEVTSSSYKVKESQYVEQEALGARHDLYGGFHEGFGGMLHGMGGGITGGHSSKTEMLKVTFETVTAEISLHSTSHYRHRQASSSTASGSISIETENGEVKLDNEDLTANLLSQIRERIGDS